MRARGVDAATINHYRRTKRQSAISTMDVRFYSLVDLCTLHTNIQRGVQTTDIQGYTDAIYAETGVF